MAHSVHAHMTHSIHQLSSARATRSRQFVARMAQIVKVKSGWQASLDDRLAPVHRPVEEVAPHRCTEP
jgi:hypothetical protein